MGCTTSTPAPAATAKPAMATKQAVKVVASNGAAKSTPTAKLDKATIIFVLGGPGSGKGTQCAKIIDKYPGVKHFSAGDLLRDAVKNGNTELEAIMKEGKLVPVEVTIKLLKDAMLVSEGSVFLIDGFPRAIDQADVFEKQIKSCNMVLAFDCPEETMRERLLARGQSSGRADDNEETIVKRFHTFLEQSKPVIDYYKTEGKCVEISSVDTPDDVFTHVQKSISERLPELTASVAQPEKQGAAVPVSTPPPTSLPTDSKVIFVLGGPGSGKGTQCAKILEEYADCGVHHFSAGDLLRDAVKNGNTELEAIMKEGKLVPMKVTINLLKDAMIASGGKTFLIDGFPRAWDQAECFESTIQPCSTVLFFDCSEEAMRERLLKRGETSGRADDNEATIVKRFYTFVEQSKPVVDEYKTQGKCHEISAMRAPEEVFVDVKSALDVLLRGAAPPVVEEAAADAPPAVVHESKCLPEGSKIVFVLGGPGSGKGTQCDKIIKRYQGVKHLSAGDLLRDAVKNGNTELEAVMKEGKLVPMQVTIDLLKDAMIASGSSVFLIDGFPRAWDQAECFEGTIQPCTAVIFFDCSEEAMRARLLKRGETSGRADDNEETIVKRFHTFVEQSKPVVDEYKTQGKCFEVSAEQTPDEVFEGVQKALDGILTVAVAEE